MLDLAAMDKISERYDVPMNMIVLYATHEAKYNPRQGVQTCLPPNISKHQVL